MQEESRQYVPVLRERACRRAPAYRSEALLRSKMIGELGRTPYADGKFVPVGGEAAYKVLLNQRLNAAEGPGLILAISLDVSLQENPPRAPLNVCVEP
jgi:hypothetical protein